MTLNVENSCAITGNRTFFGIGAQRSVHVTSTGFFVTNGCTVAHNARLRSNVFEAFCRDTVTVLEIENNAGQARQGDTGTYRVTSVSCMAYFEPYTA